MRKSILLLAGVGVGAGFLFGFGRSRKNGVGRSVTGESESSKNQEAREPAGAVDLRSEADPEIDDRGTDQHAASEILKSVRDGAFESSDEKLALALGRPVEEIEAWTHGSGTIDGDVVMKARTLAMQRGVEIQ